MMDFTDFTVALQRITAAAEAGASAMQRAVDTYERMEQDWLSKCSPAERYNYTERRHRGEYMLDAMIAVEDSRQ